MIVARTLSGEVIRVDTLECTPEDARRLNAALNASSLTVPYGTIALPKGVGVAKVRLTVDRAALPAPPHKPVELL